MTEASNCSLMTQNLTFVYTSILSGHENRSLLIFTHSRCHIRHTIMYTGQVLPAAPPQSLSCASDSTISITPDANTYSNPNIDASDCKTHPPPAAAAATACGKTIVSTMGCDTGGIKAAASSPAGAVTGTNTTSVDMLASEWLLSLAAGPVHQHPPQKSPRTSTLGSVSRDGRRCTSFFSFVDRPEHQFLKFCLPNSHFSLHSKIHSLQVSVLLLPPALVQRVTRQRPEHLAHYPRPQHRQSVRASPFRPQACTAPALPHFPRPCRPCAPRHPFLPPQASRKLRRRWTSG